MARLRKFIPVAYATQLKPGKGRVGIDEPTWVYAYDYLVLTNDKVVRRCRLQAHQADARP